jgi:hypothetical protein
MRAGIITAGVVMVFCTSSAFAFIGPPTARLTHGQWSAGANYTYSSQDLDKTKIKYDWADFDSDGVMTDSGSGSYKLEVRDLNTNLYYAHLGYGIFDSLEVYGQLGIADVKADTKEVNDDQWYGYNLDNELAWGLGGKYTFAKQDKMDWGAALQLNWYSNSVSDKFTDVFDDGEGFTETELSKETTDIDTLGIVIAVGPTIDMGVWKLYGGGLCQILTADYDYKENGSWSDSDGDSGTWTDKDSGSYDQTSFGGYVGASFDVYKNCNTAIELSFTGDGWGAGVGIEIPF